MTGLQDLAVGAAAVFTAIGIWRSRRARGAAVLLALLLWSVFLAATYFQSRQHGL